MSSLASNPLLDSLISGGAVIVATSGTRVLSRRRTERRLAKQEPAVEDHEMLLRHDKLLQKLSDAVIGTTDILGRPVPGLMQKTDELLGLVKKNGNSH